MRISELKDGVTDEKSPLVTHVRSQTDSNVSSKSLGKGDSERKEKKIDKTNLD